MNYLELRRRLAELDSDPAFPSAHARAVYFDRYDRGIGISDDRWNIVQSEGKYIAGVMERGAFTPFAHFTSEEACCDWLYKELTERPTYHRLAEKEIDRRAAERRKRYDKDLANWPKWPDQEAPPK